MGLGGSRPEAARKELSPGKCPVDVEGGVPSQVRPIPGRVTSVKDGSVRVTSEARKRDVGGRFISGSVSEVKMDT